MRYPKKFLNFYTILTKFLSFPLPHFHFPSFKCLFFCPQFFFLGLFSLSIFLYVSFFFTLPALYIRFFVYIYSFYVFLYSFLFLFLLSLLFSLSLPASFSYFFCFSFFILLFSCLLSFFFFFIFFSFLYFFFLYFLPSFFFPFVVFAAIAAKTNERLSFDAERASAELQKKRERAYPRVNLIQIEKICVTPLLIERGVTLFFSIFNDMPLVKASVSPVGHASLAVMTWL